MLSKSLDLLSDVAPFRMLEFRARTEFDDFLKSSEVLRANRWSYEQSLATLEDAVVIHGTCGLCLCEAAFTASTRAGESAPGGRVPNWREELICDCVNKLSNRQRALLHFLLSSSLIQPWTRLLALGDLGALFPALQSLSPELHCWSGGIERLPQRSHKPKHEYHLLLSMEQFSAASIQPELLSSLSGLLADGGHLVFTTPFDVMAERQEPITGSGPVGWEILQCLRECGFSDVKACMYWSEEFGYLGPFNFIFEAAK